MTVRHTSNGSADTPRGWVAPGARRVVAVCVWVAGLAGMAACLVRLDGTIIHVVRYGAEALTAPALPLTYVPHAATAAILAVLLIARIGRGGRAGLAGLAGRGSAGTLIDPSRASTGTLAGDGLPLLAGLIVAGWWWIQGSAGFVGACVVFIALGWAVSRLGRDVPAPKPREGTAVIGACIIIAVILASTAWHAVQQAHFWRHFLLGYADFGFFTTELEHCLPWKDVGAWRFHDTRMGYHAVFMFYVLAPFYALFRTPMFLMVVGPLALNAAALPFYELARRRSGSTWVGVIAGLSWLALPSLSRLPYSNTYGFQSIYLAVPWLSCAFALAYLGRWRASHLCLAGAILCEETVCGVALGWGVYLVITGRRRRDGLWITAAALAYLIACTTLIIPHFDRAGQYTRLHLFGSGLTPADVLARLTRPRVGLYLLALVGPMLVALARCWKLLVVIAPTLSLVLLMKQTDYLNLKYWHHASILVVLFTAAVLGSTGSRRDGPDGPDGPDEPATGRARSVGPILGLLTTCLLFHAALGASPMSQARRFQARVDSMNRPDPRLRIVDEIRARFAPRDATVIATERLAAHFMDYRMVLPAPGADLEHLPAGAYLLVLDRADHWDKLNIEGALDAYLARARRAGFVEAMRSGSIIVLTRGPTSPGAAP